MHTIHLNHTGEGFTVELRADARAPGRMPGDSGATTAEPQLMARMDKMGLTELIKTVGKIPPEHGVSQELEKQRDAEAVWLLIAVTRYARQRMFTAAGLARLLEGLDRLIRDDEAMSSTMDRLEHLKDDDTVEEIDRIVREQAA